MRRRSPLALLVERLAPVALALSFAPACSRPSPPALHESASRAAPVAVDAPPPRVFLGRAIAEPMSYEGADWLDRPERADIEQPDAVLDALHLAPGSTVADVGAGSGYFTVRLARRVGPTGRVIASDIQPEMLRLLERRVREAHLANVTPVECTERDARLPEAALDLALLVDVYHELARPAETLSQLRRALKSDARLVLVEYRGEDPAVAIKPEHKMTLAQVRLEVEPRGFRFVDSLEFLRDQRVIVFAAR